MKIRAVILAAGQGTRMHSQLPKVLHPLLGKPMLQYAIDVVREATQALNRWSLLGMRQSGSPGLCGAGGIVIQEPQLGTGHAVLQAESVVSRAGRSGPGHLRRYALVDRADHRADRPGAEKPSRTGDNADDVRR